MEPAAAASEARREEAPRASCRAGALPPPEAAENLPWTADADTDEPTILPGNREIRDSANIRKLRSYLNLKARVTVSDNRVFVGTFVCIDKLKNIILLSSEEFTPAGSCSAVDRT
ncbi:MAG: hypothetical protein BJ554DRAFT_237 [Olpidium bornovanus]|uniref:LSM domain-containing protein n=1 Tax=Olpidium bornovanus TaxID=278681 RepID=A0A8H7ZUB7_9FUNG|nr:MAG: hypothetical protein BJ554DRAFT_237 [Olpidium bornovanus]